MTWGFEFLFWFGAAATFEASGYPVGLEFIQHQVGYDIFLCKLHS